ncbi:MAG: sn-glycerol-1-phosphate dehydrogenase [Rhodospirillales bacterium]|nr:sn-glycerol-1-phosphate dehydrogenase [Rhodospirillales bacterium]
MSQALIDALLTGSLSDPDGGPPLRVATRSAAIAPSLKGNEADLVRSLELGRHLAVVSDFTTREVLGARVERALRALGRVTNIVLPGRPHSDAETVQSIRSASTRADALVAVGSGTINDLCKYASAQDGKPYAVFATAPSMNGYTSVNAAITVHGHKQSLTAQAPLGVFLDLSILAAAPVRMIRAGLGDSLCRPTAQADWLLAHLLLDQPYRTMPFVLLANDEAQLFASSDALMAGDLDAMACLIRTLLLSGFGTAICGNSQPASQGEHLISHFADMFGNPSWPQSFHGEQIGVTTLMMARLQERLLEGPPPMLQPNGDTESDFIRRYGESLGRSCWNELSKKRLDRHRLTEIRDWIEQSWDGIRERIAAVTRPSRFLVEVLRRSGAPVSHEELGWPRGFSERAIRHARDIRARYTFLDLAVDSGRLEQVDELL